MADTLPAWLGWPETQVLAQTFGAERLRFVGGCVRDGILQRPVNDVDAATPLPPQETMALLKQAGIKAIPTGIEHGTVTAVIGPRHFEITTLRRDVATDGRHAIVAYTDNWQEDAARRDFTMNALYCDASGTIYDYCGGAVDAITGKVRFIGVPEERIREDALRILRFFRFFAHYGKGKMDADGLAACASLAALIEGLSGERIAQEMLKLLKAAQAAEVVERMQESGVWQQVVPARVETYALRRFSEMRRAAAQPPDSILALACLLRSSGDVVALIDSIGTRWKLSRAQLKRLHILCETRVTMAEGEWKPQIRKLGKGDFIDLMLLAVSEGEPKETGLAAISLARSWEIPVFPVTGDDLLTLGMKPGKAMGEKLKALEAEWEAGGYAMGKEELVETYLKKK
jgi:poly(A) polymerase